MKRAHGLVGASAVAAIVIVGLTSSGSVQASPGSSSDGGQRRVSPPVSAQRHALVASRVQQVQTDEKRLGLGSHEDLVVKDVIADPDGTQHVRYDRTYDGLPVIGGDLVLHENSDGSTGSVNWGTRYKVDVPTTVASRSTVPRLARAAQARRVVYASHHEPVLAWETPVRGVEPDGTPINRLVYTDARTGKRLGVRENIFTDGTGQSLYSGTVPVGSAAAAGGFSMTDTARGGHKTYDATGITDEFDPATGPLFTDVDNLWGDGTTVSRQSAAVDAPVRRRGHVGLLQDAAGTERRRQQRQGVVLPRALRGELRERVLGQLLLLHDVRRRRRRHQAAGLARDRGPRDDPRGHGRHRRPRVLRGRGRPERVHVRRHGHHGRVLREQPRGPG